MSGTAQRAGRVARTVTSGAPAGGSSADGPRRFVCEDDVRVAARASRKILIDERTIVTPAARDAGEALRIFEQASWRP